MLPGHCYVVQAVIVIETDHDNPLASSSGRKAFYSAFTTFNLAVMGRCGQQQQRYL